MFSGTKRGTMEVMHAISFAFLLTALFHLVKLKLTPKPKVWKPLNQIRSENEKIRQSSTYKAWRMAVLIRDNFICQICGRKGGYLEADHIKPFAYFPDRRFDVSNGRALCKPCHQKTDSYGSKAKLNYGNH